MALWIIDIQPAKRLALEGEAIVEVVRELGHEVVETIYDPEHGGFSNELSSLFASSRPMILRGSVGFAAWTHAHWPISPGAFRSDRLRPSSYLPAYGELALNADAIITTYADFNARRMEFEERLGDTLLSSLRTGANCCPGPFWSRGVLCLTPTTPAIGDGPRFPTIFGCSSPAFTRSLQSGVL